MRTLSIKSASRVFEVLELFREERRPQRLRDVVRRFAYPTSSTAALLKSITELGYLTFDETTRSYFPTDRVALLGRWMAEPSYQRELALSWMRQVHHATGETILLGLQSGADAVYVEVMRSILPIQYFVEPGTRRPIVNCGVGWALLSQQPDSASDALLSRKQGRNRAESTRALRLRLEEVRREGYAFSRHTITPGVGVVALPVAAAVLGVSAALAVGGPVERLEERLQLILEALRAPPPAGAVGRG